MAGINLLPMLIKSVFIALRHLRNHPVTGLFNIAGLALGITTFTLLLFYIQRETSYDHHNKDHDQLFRIVNNYRVENDHNTTAWIAPGLAPNIEGQIPGVVEIVRMFRYRSPVVMVERTGNKNFTEPNSIWADANIFHLFTFNFIEGDVEQALARPNTMVISESMALKYFGITNVVGKVLSDRTLEADFEITAVVKDLPATSHFKADFVCSLSTLPSLWGKEVLNDWNNSFLYTYIKTDGSVTPEIVTARINQIASTHIRQTEQYSSAFALQRVTDIHLHSKVLNEWQANSDVRYVYILSVVAALILLVSVINYVNLWIARSEQRIKEIGIRQAIGGSKLNLALQFMVESFTHVVLAVVVSISLVGFLPQVRNWFGDDILLVDSMHVTTWIYVFIGVAAFVVVVMLYPSGVIARIRPALAIKGRSVSPKGMSVWKGLIAFQVLVTACLITSTLTIRKQVNFIQEQPLGYDADHIVNISQVSNTALRERFKDVLLRNVHVRSASGVSHLLGGTIYQSGYEVSNNGKKATVLWQRIHVDHDFCKTYQIPIVAGRDFSTGMASDSSNFIINETAARVLGYNDPAGAVGLEVNGGGNSRGQIVGVMKDFHFKTLHTTIEPLIIHIVPDRIRMLSVSVDAADVTPIVQQIEKAWKEIEPIEPFVYSTFRDSGSQNYQLEGKFRRVIMFFTVVVLLLSVSGLVSLNIYIASRRRREIGIRKILGAETSSVLFDLSKPFAMIAVMGFILSLPLTWYAMRSWLDGFAYRTELTPGIYLAGGVITFALSMMSIALPSWSTAKRKAVDVLKME